MAIIDWKSHISENFDEFLKDGYRYIDRNIISYISEDTTIPETASNSISARVTLTSTTFEMTTEIFHLSNIMKYSTGGLVVDVGCGENSLLRFMRNNYVFNPYIGLDIRGDIFSTYGKDKSTLLAVSDFVENYPIRENTAEVVVFSEVLEHLGKEEGVEVLKSIYKSLKRGGVLSLTTPVHPDSYLIDMEKEYEKWDHITYYKGAELISLLESLGYKILLNVGAKFIGKRVSRRTVSENIEKRYGEGGLRLYNEICDIWTPRIATAIAIHASGYEGGHIQVVACKEDYPKNVLSSDEIVVVD